jgi:hypothetical protein
MGSLERDAAPVEQSTSFYCATQPDAGVDPRGNRSLSSGVGGGGPLSAKFLGVLDGEHVQRLGKDVVEPDFEQPGAEQRGAMEAVTSNLRR